MVIAIIVLAWLGLAFGSFVNALVWRLHEQTHHTKSKSKTKRNLSIVSGRSICPNCRHILGWKDLVPVFSWAWLRGRCRYCKKSISWQYPVVELLEAVIFVGSYLFWPGGLHSAGQWVLLITWLGCSVGLMALAVYDAIWMLLPNKIIYPTFFLAAAGRMVYVAGFEPHKAHAAIMWILSVAVSSGIFWVLFMVSKGKWIGFGDIRLGLITGTILAHPSSSFLMILIASVLGTLFALPELLMHKRTLLSKLPYGPFLITATFLTLLFGDKILDWYEHLLSVS
jgi:prepilin signal peptidase PulO-like enzyme (type II secretory pathway)